MSIPLVEYRWICAMVLVVILAASLMLVCGFLDQDHWNVFVQGLVEMAINGAKTP